MRTITLIDGRSGAGKTTFANKLGRAKGIEMLHLDSWYPGWGGLAAGSHMVARDVLHPTRPGYTEWDWHNDRPGRWVPLDPQADYIIEGVGAVSRANIAAAHAVADRVLTYRLEADADLRRTRALERDPFFAEFWEQWASQEDEFYATEGNLPVDRLVRVTP
ncbi:hypothetical protein [Corynebacterium tapiri]|uniref:Adenylate kinase n=1 Tax=Corynebacterium tapiri TaxID=1448266 RepID=A0A5C4U7K9_9CORY|nr:hypothetical protein [Corynebacterium tapiri]TNM00548.1 hypothetical protein FHE74_00975 [Corynebacterium tapiri]